MKKAIVWLLALGAAKASSLRNSGIRRNPALESVGQDFVFPKARQPSGLSAPRSAAAVGYQTMQTPAAGINGGGRMADRKRNGRKETPGLVRWNQWRTRPGIHVRGSNRG